MPRVLHVVSSDQRRGAEGVGVELASALRARGREDTCVALTSAGPGGHPVTALGPSRYHPRTLLALRRAARRSDVVVAHGSSTLVACGTALAGSGVPFVYVNIGDPLFWAGHGLRHRRVRALLSRAAAVAAISRGARDALVDRFGVEPGRVAVVPNGRDPQRYRPPTPQERSAARERWSLGDAPVVAWVGSLTAEKRPDLALDVARRLPHVRLLLVGEGPLAADLAARAGDSVVLTGRLEDPRPVYAAADLLLLTSDSEGVPGVLVEAGLSGLAAVATDVGYVREVVRPGLTGALVPAGDGAALAAAVEACLPRAADLGRAAREHCVAHHGSPLVVDRWAMLTERVAAGRTVAEEDQG